ncbi:MAG TPA: transcription elongation factor GreA [Candidatus Hydrogenedentes bacterium]|nr:transcription elongation factor GreA [Candidatus Hydrogenedentota bacterium]HPG67034.1 transcription elongation factor GreA [Candidatus Hydrogenedentota bacterium]
MTKLYVSKEGLEKLKADLEYCNAKRMRVAAVIEQARGYGDLSENAEYHAAKEEQAKLHARIRDLEDKVARAVILNDDDIDASKAYQGARVRVLNKKMNREMTYHLVSPVETDMASGKISVQSPVGKALLGHSVGDRVVATVPAGDLEFEILEISRD